MPKPAYAVTFYKVLFEVFPYTKNWQSCCSASQVCRVYCKKVMLAGAQVCLVMTGDCPQVVLVAGWYELCAIIQKQPAADMYLLSKCQWSGYSLHLQAETVNAFLVLVIETHNHYWTLNTRTELISKQMHAVFSGKNSILIWISWLQLGSSLPCIPSTF